MSSQKDTPLRLRIRAARERAGMSQSALGAMPGVGYIREEINRFENGARYSPVLAYKLARALRVRISVDEVFGPLDEAGP